MVLRPVMSRDLENQFGDIYAHAINSLLLAANVTGNVMNYSAKQIPERSCVGTKNDGVPSNMQIFLSFTLFPSLLICSDNIITHPPLLPNMNLQCPKLSLNNDRLNSHRSKSSSSRRKFMVIA